MKKFILMALLCAPMTMFAQKFGHINSQEIMTSMPEFSIAQGEIQAKAKEFENEMSEMQQEFQRKAEEFDKVRQTLHRPSSRRQRLSFRVSTQSFSRLIRTISSSFRSSSRRSSSLYRQS